MTTNWTQKMWRNNFRLLWYFNDSRALRQYCNQLREPRYLLEGYLLYLISIRRLVTGAIKWTRLHIVKKGFSVYGTESVKSVICWGRRGVRSIESWRKERSDLIERNDWKKQTGQESCQNRLWPSPECDICLWVRKFTFWSTLKEERSVRNRKVSK